MLIHTRRGAVSKVLGRTPIRRWNLEAMDAFRRGILVNDRDSEQLLDAYWVALADGDPAQIGEIRRSLSGQPELAATLELLDELHRLRCLYVDSVDGLDASSRPHRPTRRRPGDSRA